MLVCDLIEHMNNYEALRNKKQCLTEMHMHSNLDLQDDLHLMAVGMAAALSMRQQGSVCWCVT